MNKLAVNLPLAFICFRNLEKRMQFPEEKQTKRELHEQDSCPNVCPETVEVPEADTSLAKTSTNLLRASTSEKSQ